MITFLKQPCKILLCLLTLISAAVQAQQSLLNPVQQAYIKASNTGINDFFGGSIAISADGNTLAVGAIGESSAAIGVGGNENDNSAGAAGAVYIFVRSGNTWSQQAYIKASNTDSGDVFATSLALSSDGNTLAVGASGEDANPSALGGQNNNTFSSAGAVYVFMRTGNQWAQQAYLKASNANAGDQFGHALALSDNGNTLAVGAFAEQSNATGINPFGSPLPPQTGQYNNSAVLAGAVYVFIRTAGVWSQQAYIKASNTDAQDQFGYSLALSGDGSCLAVGAYGEDSSAIGIANTNQDDNSRLQSGAVYIFIRTANLWYQQAYIKASKPDKDDVFGRSLALANDGNTLVVSAFLEDSNATGVDGNQTDNSATDAGAVYVFTRSGVNWSQQAYLKASNTDVGDNFGYSLALSGNGNVLAIGAYKESSGATGINGYQFINNVPSAGAAYLFARSATSWLQQDYIKASNTDAGDLFAYALVLSDDASTLTVGAQWENSSTIGINSLANNASPESGAVYTFISNGYNVGGVLTGLSAGESITLQNNGGDDLTLTANGNFTFGTPVANGGNYAVTTSITPATKTCTVANGSGLVNNNSITDVTVHCWLPGVVFADSFE